jgi:hypothetical protein
MPKETSICLSLTTLLLRLWIKNWLLICRMTILTKLSLLTVGWSMSITQQQVPQATLGGALTALSPTTTRFLTQSLWLVFLTQHQEIHHFFRPTPQTTQLMPSVPLMILWTQCTMEIYAFRVSSPIMVRKQLMLLEIRLHISISRLVSWKLSQKWIKRPSLFGQTVTLITVDNLDLLDVWFNNK